MTLRELGASVGDWFSKSYEAVTTKGPLDWPLEVVIVASIPIVLVVLIEIGYRLDRKKLMEEHQRWRRASGHRDENGIPLDPNERLEWANRTGRYAPGAERAK